MGRGTRALTRDVLEMIPFSLLFLSLAAMLR